jgi:hypothetical protein
MRDEGRIDITVAIEAETRIRDVQTLLRRIALKREAAGDVPVVLLVADSPGDRHALAAGRQQFAAEFPTWSRAALRSLCAGMVPASDSIIVLGPDRSATVLRTSAPEAAEHESSSA